MSTIDGGEVSASQYGRFPPGKQHSVFIEWEPWVCTRDALDVFEGIYFISSARIWELDLVSSGLVTSATTQFVSYPV